MYLWSVLDDVLIIDSKWKWMTKMKEKVYVIKKCISSCDTGHTSNCVESRALKHKSAGEIARFLFEDNFCRHGSVQII